MAGLLELRTYASLLVTYLVKCLSQFGNLLVVVQQFVHRHACLVNLSHHLYQTQVIVLTHQKGDKVVNLVVFLACLLKQFHGKCHLYSLLNFGFVVQTHGGGLQPHHTTEVAFQRVTAGVVTTSAEKTIGE